MRELASERARDPSPPQPAERGAPPACGSNPSPIRQLTRSPSPPAEREIVCGARGSRATGCGGPAARHICSFSEGSKDSPGRKEAPRARKSRPSPVGGRVVRQPVGGRVLRPTDRMRGAKNAFPFSEGSKIRRGERRWSVSPSVDGSCDRRIGRGVKKCFPFSEGRRWPRYEVG